MTEKRILIVDEDSLSLQEIASLLGKNGFDIITATDGLTGLKRARSEEPDAVLLDAMLPVVNGYQVCRLYKFDDRFRSVPLVLMSVKGTEEDKALSGEIGADYYLTKPVDPDELMRIINKIFKKEDEEESTE